MGEPLLTGEVAAFDVDVGLGQIRSDDGRELMFHCTEIADGSRTIDVGQRVGFRLDPTHHGRWAAGRIVVL